MAMQPYGSGGIPIAAIVLALAAALAGCEKREAAAPAPPVASAPVPGPDATKSAEARLPSPPVAMAPAPASDSDRAAVEVDDPSTRPPPAASESRLKLERRSEPIARQSAPRRRAAERAPAAETTGDALAAVDRAMAGLTDATIAFNTPRTMNLRNTAEIQLLLAVQETAVALKQAVTASGETESARVKVSSRMEARLTGANFQITAISPEEQAISRSGTTEWKWEVKPTQAGSHQLHLTLTALFDVERSGLVRRGIKTFDQTIDVEVTWDQQFMSFFEENWQWLWAAILVPVGGWLWKRRRA